MLLHQFYQSMYLHLTLIHWNILIVFNPNNIMEEIKLLFFSSMCYSIVGLFLGVQWKFRVGWFKHYIKFNSYSSNKKIGESKNYRHCMWTSSFSCSHKRWGGKKSILRIIWFKCIWSYVNFSKNYENYCIPSRCLYGEKNLAKTLWTQKHIVILYSQNPPTEMLNSSSLIKKSCGHRILFQNLQKSFPLRAGHHLALQ